jgi:uncharacterized protein YybS (DUF2232 family)
VKPTNTRALVEGALLSAITIIISLFALYVPILGIFASLIWPVPIVILGIRHGIKTSVMATVVAGIVVAMFEGPAQAITVVLGFGLIGICMGWAIRKKYAPFRVLAIGGVASLISKIVLILVSLYIMGINPISQEISIMRESLSAVNNLYSGMGVNPDTIRSVTDSFNKMIDMMAVTIPAILVLASILDAFLNYMFTKVILSRLGQQITGLTPFWLWKLPPYTVFLFLLGMLMTMMETYWPVGVLKTVGFNLQMVFFFTFLVEGFSLIAYYMGKYNVSKVFRVIVVFLIFFNPFIAQIISWAGMFDILFNFRQL